MEMEKDEEAKLVEENSLLLRKSRSGNENKIFDMDRIDVEVSNEGTNMHASQYLVTANNEEKNVGIENKVKEFGDSLQNESQDKKEQSNSENIVIFDKDEGIWKCRICSWIYQNGSVCLDHTQNHKGQINKLMMNIKSLNFVKGVDSSSTDSRGKQIQSSSTFQSRNADESSFRENLSGKQIQSSSTFQSSEILQELFAIHGSSKDIERGEEIKPTKGDDLEVTEIDVENVLQKQNTHDLYCPNCNSCITRRVILRKRKRRLRISDEEAKRNKLDPNLVIGSVQVSSDGVGVDDSTELPILDENEHDREPDVFRCLSCFSFFIPNGNGFKLFRIFGDKSINENVQGRVTTSTRKNWFTSLFAPNKQKTFVGQDEGERDVRVPLISKLGDQTGEPSSPLDVQFLGQTSGTAQNIETFESGDETLPFLKKESETGKTLFGLEDKSSEVTTETNQTGAIMEHVETHPDEQLEEFKSSKGVKLSHEDNLSIEAPPKTTKVTTGESANNTFSPPQGGLKLLISSAGRNVTPELLHEGHNKPTKSISNLVAAPYKQSQVGTPILTDSSAGSTETGKDAIVSIDSRPAEPSLTLQSITVPTVTGDGGRSAVRTKLEIEVVKSIVYGGLAESITSLSIISAAAGGGASTLNALALGMANLIGGLFIICQNLWEIRNDCAEQVSNQVSEHRDRYRVLLGQRENFILHAALSLLSYLIFGSLPLVVYGFSFRKNNDKELKLLVVSAASLLCIMMLAIAKAYVQTPPKPYLKTILTFVILGLMVSGISYVSGVLFERLLEKLRVFRPSSGSNLHLREMIPVVGILLRKCMNTMM